MFDCYRCGVSMDKQETNYAFQPTCLNCVTEMNEINAWDDTLMDGLEEEEWNE